MRERTSERRGRRHRVAVVATLLAGAALALASAGSAEQAEQVHLGGKAFAGRDGAGWGAVRPHRIFNGGDPSGLVDHIHWRSWGGAVAVGTGLHAIFRPHGGYYRHRVVAILRAGRLGWCEGKRAYRKLWIKEPRRPGGKLGPWYAWSGAGNVCERPY
jgi:hypothetical protein